MSALRDRLGRLFKRYNQLYWHKSLPDCSVVAAHLQNCVGQFDPRTRTIKIDVAKHRSGRELRSTLLHEMCHVAASRNGSRGHDTKFFEQLERLLRRKAPISIADPEAGAVVRSVSEVVPLRFPLVRRKMERIAAKQRQPLERYLKAKKLRPSEISDEEIICQFENVAAETTWRQALSVVGLRNQLVDETGRPLNARFRRLVAMGKKAHARARRSHVKEARENEEIQRYNSQPPDQRGKMPHFLAREIDKLHCKSRRLDHSSIPNTAGAPR